MTIEDYAGTYTVRTANLEVPTGWTYDGPSVAVGQIVVISVVDKDTACVQVGNQPFEYQWAADSLTLQHFFSVTAAPTGSGNQSLPALNQISLASNGSFKAIYSATIAGDPQQVGVWGADDGGS